MKDFYKKRLNEGFADTIYDPNAPSLMKSMKSDSPALTFQQKVCSDLMGRCGKSSNTASENPSSTPPVGSPSTPPVGSPSTPQVNTPATPTVDTPAIPPSTPNPTKPIQPYTLTKLATRVKPIRVKPIRLKEVTTGTGRPIDIEQGERLGNLKDSLKRKLEMERSSGIEDNATYKDAPHAFRRQDSTRDKLARIQQFMSAKGGNKKATKASNDNRNYYKK
jgi:hypothetical protein